MDRKGAFVPSSEIGWHPCYHARRRRSCILGHATRVDTWLRCHADLFSDGAGHSCFSSPIRFQCCKPLPCTATMPRSSIDGRAMRQGGSHQLQEAIRPEPFGRVATLMQHPVVLHPVVQHRGPSLSCSVVLSLVLSAPSQSSHLRLRHSSARQPASTISASTFPSLRCERRAPTPASTLPHRHSVPVPTFQSCLPIPTQREMTCSVQLLATSRDVTLSLARALVATLLV